MNQRGFSLIELIVILVIMGALLSIATISFSDWVRKSQIEKQIREFVSDLNNARSESVFRKRQHSIVINNAATGYAFRSYSSANEDRSTGGTELFNKSSSYRFSRDDGSSASNLIFQFDIRGFAATDTDTGSIRIDSNNSDAALDCVVITTSKINIGKMEGGSCVRK